MKLNSILALILSLSFTSIALGAEPTFGNGTDPIFTQLQTYFARGAQPQASDLTGWYSGRCFYYSRPSTAFGMVLAGMMVDDQAQNPGDNGPLFPPSTSPNPLKFLLINHGGTNVPANRYDDLTPADHDSIQSYLDSPDFRLGYPLAFVSDGSWASRNDRGNNLFRARKGDQYLFVEVRALRNDGAVRADQVVSMCYFFKKVN